MPFNRMTAVLALLLMTFQVRAEELPDIDMLEYLGNFETVNGEYVDPQTLYGEDVAEAERQDKTPREKVTNE